ncbi:MAG: phosphoadenosine phosphosulfate reductase family protein [Candidatus Methanoperedens sp.]
MEAGNMNVLKAETLEEKEKLAKNIIIDNIKKAKNPFVLFDGDNYSLIILHMVREIQKTPVLFVDTSLEFEEIHRFVEKMRKLWRFDLIKEVNKINVDDVQRSFQLRAEVIKNAAKKHNIDLLFTDLESMDGSFVNPISTFSKEDIWNYIKKYNLPYCSLYDKGYEVIDFKPCAKIKDMPEQKDEEIIKEKLKKLGYL